METLQAIISFITQNYVAIMAIIGSIIGTASAICALTDTPKDDEFMAKIYKIIEFLGLNIGKAKDK